MRGRIVASVALGIFVILTGLTLAGRFGSRVGAADVTPTLHEGDNRETTTLFLFVPGIDGTKGASEAFGMAGELHCGGICEKFPLPGNGGLDEGSEQQAAEPDQPEKEPQDR